MAVLQGVPYLICGKFELSLEEFQLECRGTTQGIPDR